MNAPQQGTSTASAIAGALVTLICAAWLAAFGKQVDPTVQNAINYLLTVAISFKTHGGALPTLADIKASVIADLAAAGKVVAAPAAAPTAAILLAFGLSAGALSACSSAQLQQADVDIQDVIAKVNTDVATVSGDVAKACVLAQTLAAAAPLVLAVQPAPVIAAEADITLVCVTNAAINAAVNTPSPANLISAIQAIQAAVKPAVAPAT